MLRLATAVYKGCNIDTAHKQVLAAGTDLGKKSDPSLSSCSGLWSLGKCYRKLLLSGSNPHLYMHAH